MSTTTHPPLAPIDGPRCRVTGCPYKVIAKGYCGRHYARIRRTGKAGHPRLKLSDIKKTPPLCQCGDISKVKGLCMKCYNRKRARYPSNVAQQLSGRAFAARHSAVTLTTVALGMLVMGAFPQTTISGRFTHSTILPRAERERLQAVLEAFAVRKAEGETNDQPNGKARRGAARGKAHRS